MSIAVPSRQQIAAAAARIAPWVRRTPAVRLGGSEFDLPLESITFKLEQLQHTGSFKPRGAFNRILAADVPEAGLIAASGGNHGLAVAFAGTRLGVATEIFVPETVPPIKLARLRGYGATVHLVGQVYDVAREASEKRALETGALVVHAYDQPDVVTGAGTVGRELQDQTRDIDTVLVAVGGGGLIGGIAAWSAGNFRIVAVEPHTCATLNAALAAQRPVEVPVGGIARDSLGARQIGDIGFAAVQGAAVQSVLVSDRSIAAAQHLLWDRLRLVVEPGGATALAALVSGAYVPEPGERVAVLICGANTDPATLSVSAAAESN
jgi:threonine dehydratase